MSRSIALLLSMILLAGRISGIAGSQESGGTTSPPTIHLSQAKIVILDDSPVVKKAAIMLQEELQRRTRLLLETTTALPVGDSAAILLAIDPATLPEPGWPKALSLPQTRDAYAIWTDNRKGRVFLLGHDPRGALFAAGRFLRLAEIGDRQLSFPAQTALATAPEFPLRGHQLGFRSTPNSYDAWDLATYEQYIRDLILFGTNAIELTPTLDPREGKNPVMKLPPWEMNARLSVLLDSYDLDVWCWIPVYVAAVGTEEKALREMERWRSFFRSMKRLDALLVPGGDDGDTPVEILLPWLQRVSGVLKEVHPRAKLWISNQTFEKEQNDYFFHFLEQQQPDWLEGVAFGPWSRIGIEEMRRRTPRRYALRRYEDTTHTIRCQYSVTDWDPVFAHTLGREPICPLPEATTRIFHRFQDSANGFLSYSEGIHDDLNKIVWSALGWDSRTRVETILAEYEKVFFRGTPDRSVARGLLHLEENWKGPVRINTGIARTFAEWKAIAGRHPGGTTENWRLQMYLFRACFDAYVQEKARAEAECELRLRKQLQQLTQAAVLPTGQEALVLLEQSTKTPALMEYRRLLLDLGRRLFQSIGFQLSVHSPFFASGRERGALLDWLDTTVSDVPWMAAQLREMEALNDPAERHRRIRQILDWENPGPGGFYDDLGNPEKSPHLVRQKSAEEDPGGLTTPRQDFINHDGWRLSWLDQAQTLFGEPLRMRYEGLDAGARYRLRVTYTGRFKATMSLKTGEIPVHGPILQPSTPQPMEFDLPRQSIRDGRLDLSWHLVSGRGCQVAEVWLLKRSLHPPEKQ